MKIKTKDLIGATLDWAVAKCEGYIDDWNSWLHEATVKDVAESGSYHPSTDWSIGGPIIERERILVQPEIGKEGAGNAWSAIAIEGFECFGSTPLIAAMRCFCCSKLGDVVDIPEELCQ